MQYIERQMLHIASAGAGISDGVALNVVKPSLVRGILTQTLIEKLSYMAQSRTSTNILLINSFIEYARRQQYSMIQYNTIISCGAKAQQTPSPCCASRHRAVSPN